jgi:hypothetical protein
VIGAESNLRIGVPRLEFERLRQAVFDLATEALRQRLDHRDALAVAAEGVGMEVPAIGIGRRFLLLLLAASGDLQEQGALTLVISLEVIRVDGGRLVGRVIAGQTTGQTRFDGLSKVSGVITAPGVRYFRIVRKRLAVAAMQACPVLLQRSTGIAIGFFGIGKLAPGHDLPPGS